MGITFLFIKISEVIISTISVIYFLSHTLTSKKKKKISSFPIKARRYKVLFRIQIKVFFVHLYMGQFRNKMKTLCFQNEAKDMIRFLGNIRVAHVWGNIKPDL